MTVSAASAQVFNDAAHLHPECCCFGARIDLIGTYSVERVSAGRLNGDPLPAVVELKTGTKLQPTFGLQLAGQALAHDPEGAWRYARFVARLRADGAFDTSRDLTCYDNPRDFATVRAAARVAQWRLANDTKVRRSDAGPHALYREDGTRVPGIGTVLSLAGLTDLRDIPPHILQAAAEKGQKVHQLVQFFCENDLDETSIDPALAGYLDSFKRFRDATGFVVEHCEWPVVFDCQR